VRALSKAGAFSRLARWSGRSKGSSKTRQPAQTWCLETLRCPLGHQSCPHHTTKHHSNLPHPSPRVKLFSWLKTTIFFRKGRRINILRRGCGRAQHLVAAAGGRNAITPKKSARIGPSPGDGGSNVPGSTSASGGMFGANSPSYCWVNGYGIGPDGAAPKRRWHVVVGTKRHRPARRVAAKSGPRSALTPRAAWRLPARPRWPS